MTGTSTSGSATISPCGEYRYRLSRAWGDGKIACFIMLNPSTADAEKDDPTIRRCMGFAKSWGCGGLVVVNLFAFRATDPNVMKLQRDPVGFANNEATIDAAKSSDPVIAAWGSHGDYRHRAFDVRRMLNESGIQLKALGLTQGGHPRHPLYVRSDAQLIDYGFGGAA